MFLVTKIKVMANRWAPTLSLQLHMMERADLRCRLGTKAVIRVPINIYPQLGWWENRPQNARRVTETDNSHFITVMTKPQEFTIQVQSEDPKKKEKPEENEKDKAEGSSKLLKDVKPDSKEDEGEELVRMLVVCQCH
jgi:hypothetical protein